MTGPHTEGVFYTIRAWPQPGDDEQLTDVYFRWTREGIWDDRITEWEVGALEAEERGSALEVFAAFIENPYGAKCPTCTRTAQPHCPGCAACPGRPHAWWCHGDTCICGCPRSRHFHKTIRGVTTREGLPYAVVRRCRASRCGCRGYEDVESQAALLAWFDCTDEERAERRAVLAAIVQEFVLGLGIHEGPFNGLGALFEDPVDGLDA